MNKKKQPESDQDLITSVEAAHLLGISLNTLNVWRYEGRNLPYRRDGLPKSRVRYRKADVLKFLEKKNYEWVYPTTDKALPKARRQRVQEVA